MSTRDVNPPDLDELPLGWTVENRPEDVRVWPPEMASVPAGLQWVPGVRVWVAVWGDERPVTNPGYGASGKSLGEMASWLLETWSQAAAVQGS